MRYAVILAGGTGQRLWPLSRQDRPKQLLPLIHGKNLLQLAVERLAGIFPLENVLIVTNREHAAAIAQEFPGMPRENVVGEPMGRDTANAVALAAEILARRDDTACMGVFTADQVIRPLEAFHASVSSAFDVADRNPDALVTFGIKPTWPHTGLGYIHRGQRIVDGVYEVQAFREKPDHHTARRYVESGEYYWNSGMFVWRVETIRQQLQSFLPESMELIAQALQASDAETALSAAYPQLKKISIDFAVMERAPRVLAVELACEWLDVGSWPNLAQVSEIDEDGNAVVASKTTLVDCQRNVVVSEDDHLIAVLGIDDCIVVHSKDATLVCNKNESQRLKELVEQIRQQFGDKYV